MHTTAYPLTADPSRPLEQGWVATLSSPALHAHHVQLPLFAESIPAGFPSPAQDYEEARLDLNEHIILRPEATFLLRVKGHSMIEANIRDGDIVVVDRSLAPRHGHIVIAEVDGGFTIKTLWRQGNCVKLVPANPRHQPITFPEGTELVIFGVVTWILHKALG